MSVIIFQQKTNVIILTVLSLKNTALEKNGLLCTVKQNKYKKKAKPLYAPVIWLFLLLEKGVAAWIKKHCAVR